MNFFRSPFFKKLLLTGGFALLWQTFHPSVALALTGGPSQPEFASFEPVSANKMVNEFSGDFTYNLPVLEVPGPEGGGYSLSLSYHSGNSPEEEASWVGYGWSLNPGAINRKKRGIPDDHKGEDVEYWNRSVPNRTLSAGGSAQFEAFSYDIPVNVNASLRYNNYKGFGYTTGAGITLADGLVSLGFSLSDGEHSFSADVNPASLLSKIGNESGEGKKKGTENNAQSEGGDADDDDDNDGGDGGEDEAGAQDAPGVGDGKKGGLVQAGQKALQGVLSKGYKNLTNSFNNETFNDNNLPFHVSEYESGSFRASFGVVTAPSPAEAGPEFGGHASYSWLRNKERSVRPSYGYMYAHSSTSEDVMHDHFTERQSPYKKRDKTLPLTFNNADRFMASGEAIGGGFRLHKHQVGHSYPNYAESRTDIVKLGGSIELGMNYGGGASIGGGGSISLPDPLGADEDLDLGGHTLEVSGRWHENDDTFGEADFSKDHTFRFLNDKAGMVRRGTTAPQQAKLSEAGGSNWANMKYEPDVSHVQRTMEGGHTHRSSFIAHHTNDEILKEENGNKYEAYERSSDVHDLVDRSAIPDQIGEFAVFNKEGMRYTYGLPVYTRNNLDMKYGLDGLTVDVKNNYLAFRDIENEKPQVKQGQVAETPHANSYLLTQITTPDYVDRTHNGPTDDDLGGWTKFKYDRAYGSDDKEDGSDWYKWRTPYRGLLYRRGELSTQMDDIGTVRGGEKEVYYLDTVETRTHVAAFITSPRTDAHAAPDHEDATLLDNITNTSDPLQKLDEIRLYAKDENGNAGKLLRTVNFEYDYSAFPGAPNADSGKLTLKRVWFDHEGTVPARIAPYTFEYTYPSGSAYDDTPHPDLDDHYDPSLDETPSYDPYLLDGWGNYAGNDLQRKDEMKTWNDQTPGSDFDPAAWQLKRIGLPSGGELHVQYEQDEYRHVQDKRAHAMVPLRDKEGGSSRYYLDLASIGVDDSQMNPEIDRFIDLLETIYEEGSPSADPLYQEDKIYFKFLYNLLGTGTPQIEDCNSEYISGYLDVAKVGWDINKGVYIEVDDWDDGGRPYWVCRDYLKTQRAGMLTINGNCDASQVGIDYGQDPLAIMESFLTFLTTAPPLAGAPICGSMNLDLSYFRVPVPKPKKGGGVRVKRLLLHDEGSLNDEEGLYGDRYRYETRRGKASGVATNEPMAFREENILVRVLDREGKGFWDHVDKVVSGEDRKQLEGPIGESVMSGASVGYSRVVKENVHEGETSPGFEDKRFYTARDRPVEVRATEIDREKTHRTLPTGIINIVDTKRWATQGYTIIKNDFHGKPRSTTTYAGDPDDMAKARTTSKQEYDYFPIGKKVPAYGEKGCLYKYRPGREQDLSMGVRGVVDKKVNTSLEFDIDVGVAFVPIPFASLMPSMSRTRQALRSHVTTQVLSETAMVKEVRSTSEGIEHVTRNLAFDRYTGEAMYTESADGFDGLDLEQSTDHKGKYQDIETPASHNYRAMGPRAENEGEGLVSDGSKTEMILKETVTPEGEEGYLIDFSGKDSCKNRTELFGGDLVELRDDNGRIGFFHVGDGLSKAKAQRLVHPAAAFNTNLSFTTPNDGIHVTVIKSGRTNQLSTVSDKLRSYGESPSPSSLLSQANSIYSEGYYECREEQCDSTGHSCAYDCGNELSPSDLVEAQVTSFTDHWDYDTSLYVSPPDPESNDYETGMKGKWRPEGQYVYEEEVIDANSGAERVYADAGVFVDFDMFDHEEPANNDSTKWLEMSRTTARSPHGNATEEVDIRGVFSTAKFGYDNTVPYLTASNANKDQILFESFEKDYDPSSSEEFEDGWEVNTERSSEAHSGDHSVELNEDMFGTKELEVKPFNLDEHFLEEGFLVKAWVRDTAWRSSGAAMHGELDDGQGTTLHTGFEKVARTGEWALYEALVSGPELDTFSLGAEITPRIVNDWGSDHSIWVDDLRYQPLDAEMKAHVYDTEDLKVICTFDGQHFGMFHQYNARGELIRRIKETERGRKTLEEQYQNRPPSSR